MEKREGDRELAMRIAQLAAEQGGRAYLVGGCVRDALLGRESKDLDIEIHGLERERVERMLDGLGEHMSMGESFGIYAIKGYGLDIALPRREKAKGNGHKDFDVCVDPFIGTQSAAMRRDFTINAMMQDVLTGEIIDHFGGRADLEQGVLRHVNDRSFGEDPLRVLRAAQFAARFGFSVAQETVELCRHMDLQYLPRERIEGEMKKALLQAQKPSVFFEVLRGMDKLEEWFPEVQALIGVEQSPVYHAEGDVWAHTMLVLDEAARFRDEVSNPFGLMLAAVAHDFGKAVCTENVDGHIHAYGHEEKGLPLTERFLRRITGEEKLIRNVLSLVRLHMKPNVVAAARSAVRVTNRMFDQAEDPVALIGLAVADDRGKIPPQAPPDGEQFLRERLALYRACMEKPRVMGRDLLEAGLKPGEDFSQILDYAHKLHLAGLEKESALKQTLAYAADLRKKQEGGTGKRAARRDDGGRSEQSLTRTSKYISMLLRHRPEAAGLELDAHGWVGVDDLIRAVSRTHVLDRQLLDVIVATDEKQRYAYSPDGTRIRANQGHSVAVDVELERREPPEFLWHGTGEKYVDSILGTGLSAKSRLYVHLSAERETALAVGSRHGSPALFRVRAGQMAADGFPFFLSANGVWLTWYVPAIYLERET